MPTNLPTLLTTRPETARALRTELLGRTSILLYGAGTMGRDSLTVLQRAGVSVPAFLDAKNLPVGTIQGIPVFKPDDPAFTAAHRRDTTVVVTIFNAFADMPAIHSRLAALGWERVVSFTEFYEAFAAELGNRYWLTSRSYYEDLGPQLNAARALLEDEMSRAVFDSTLRFRMTGDYATLGQPDPERQYFPADIPAWPSPLRLIDCGACDGDTLRQIRALGVPMEAYAGFEPDPDNFAKLAVEAVVSQRGHDLLTALWPCGVWSHACQLRFATGHGAGSAFSSQGDAVVQCAALDQVLPTFRPNLIKMDIEGAEPAALLGAARMIRAHRPGLAICVYHEPAHLWQIPQLIAAWNLGYRFYLRSHRHSGFDLVLYALPA